MLRHEVRLAVPISRPTWLLLAALSVALLCLPWTQASAASGIYLTINQIDDSAFPQVVAYVTLADGNGVPVADVPADAVGAAEDGQPIEALEFRPVSDEQRGVALVLALDVSGSMSGTPLRATQEAAKSLISGLGPLDSVAILAFDTQLHWAQDFTTDRGLLAQAVDGLNSGGDTAFNDALYAASDRMAGFPSGRRAIVILTDGEDTASTLGLDNAIEKAQDNGTPVFLIGFGSRIKPDVLNRVAQLTAGQYFEAPEPGALTSAFQQILQQLRGQYVVSYRSEIVPDMKEHELLVRVGYSDEVFEDSHRFLARAPAPVITMAKMTEETILRGRVGLTPTIVSETPVTKVRYALDGTQLAELDAHPYGWEWDTATVPPGEYTLSILAENQAGHVGQWEQGVTVAPPLEVRFRSPVEASRVGGAAILTVEWVAAYNIAEVAYELDGQPLGRATASPFQLAWRTDSVANGTHRLSARAVDVEGNTASAEIEILVVPAISVAFRTPQTGDIVTDEVPVVADIEAMSGVARVEFWVDGEQLATREASPFEFTWDTRRVPAGEHTLEIRAIDLNGEQAEEQIAVRVPLIATQPDRRWIWLAAALLVFPVLFLVGARARARSHPSSPSRRGQPLAFAPPATAWLEWRTPDGRLQTFPLSEGENALGRSRLENQIVIPGASVSRRHAVIHIRGGSYTFQNLSERSVSIINGEQVTDAHPLRAGDRITLGQEKLVFKRREEGQ